MTFLSNIRSIMGQNQPWTRVSALLLMVVGSGMPAAFAGEIPQREIAQRARQITVRISGQETTGTGAIIAQDGPRAWVLTCRDVAESLHGGTQIHTHDGQHYPINLSQMRSVKGMDLVLIPFATSYGYGQAEIGDSTQLAQGDGVYVAGFSALGQGREQEATLQFSNGMIASVLPPSPAGYGFTHTTMTAAGMSGSPVLNSAGQVVGIHCQPVQGWALSQEPMDETWKLGIPIHRLTPITQSMGLDLNLATSGQTPVVPRVAPRPINPQTVPPPPADGRIW
ncbi:serine protease [Roseofilum sp. BLCC_M154]|uniref:Serine protease n=1 Tax=Roseofilum acuticapitatum BLCC-M154 TaxID=3022444 RepID=A0ABT7AWP2_9CYAN|nr:serine protease [Roseofilum acuticapitatum]MDJ1171311.1 serine protease [Roseofilum acuticapitatum BLCC-M154]